MSPSTSATDPFGLRNKVSWVTAIAVGIFHVGAIAAFFFIDWTAIAVAAFLYWLTLSCGIGMGYHRLHTHRSYVVPRPLEYFFAVLGTLTLEGGPMFWVATHRVHHQNSDQPGDPHSPRDGAWWSHIGWIIFGEAKHSNTELMAKYVPDLARDPFYRWLNTYHFVPLTVLGIGLFLWGGLPMLLWGIFFRVTVGLHATWLVNSATHMWGSKRFKTRDDSRNNFLVAMVTFGEGWHNNHHAHPTSSRHGLAWWEFDLTYLQIRLLEILGIAKKVKVASVDEPYGAERRVA
ncbi:MAG: fatty acid desaturase [Bryobacterales bacterium]|nr:fatty acid desaturase [Bryobacterales bacterium]